MLPSMLQTEYVDYIIYIGLASNGIVFILAILFAVFLLFEIRKTMRAIVQVNSLGFYTQSQNGKIFRLRTVLYRDNILIIVVVIQAIQCIAFILLVVFERYIPILTNWWEHLYIDVTCEDNLGPFPSISIQNPITASIEGFFYSTVCMLYLFLAILMSYFVKVYDDRTNPSLLSYKREYSIAMLAILQFMFIWGLYSVYWIGRIAGFLAIVCIAIDFLVLLYFVYRLKRSIKLGISCSDGDTRAKYTMLYREYMCIAIVFITSIIIYSFGLIVGVFAQWYLVLFDCKWLIGIFHKVEDSNEILSTNFPITLYHSLTILLVITVIQFNCILIILTMIYAVSSLIQKCKAVTQEERPILLESEASFASSEYTISGNHGSYTASNNGSNTSNTTM